jgi:hypothetical protein
VRGAADARPGAPVTKKVRVVVGDDHPLFGDGVMCALASSGEVSSRRRYPTSRCALTGCPSTTWLAVLPVIGPPGEAWGFRVVWPLYGGRVYRLRPRLAPNNCQDGLSRCWVPTF